MKKQKKKQSEGPKFGYIFLILVFVAGITFLGLSIFMPKKSNDDNDLSTAINETERKDNPDTEAQNNTDNPDKTPKKYEGDDESDETKINADISTNEISNGKYILRVTIYELLGEGTCKLHMETQNGDSVDRSAKIEAIGPDSSSCDGFDIATSGISSGTYNFSVTMTSGSKTGTVKGVIKI